MRPFIACCFCALIAACTTFPEVDAAAPTDVKSVAYPKVIPLDNILNPPVARLDENSEASLQGRINGLRRRAADLEAVDLN